MLFCCTQSSCSSNGASPLSEPPLETLTLLSSSRELSYSGRERQTVMIGVMTAAKYVDTRAKSIIRTWGRHVPGEVRC